MTSLPRVVGVAVVWVLLAGVALGQQAGGWRGDGTGCFPAAAPVKWDGQSKAGILWRTAVGTSPNSSPLVVNGRVFVTVGPARLVCVDAGGGKVLWQADNGFADLTPPMADRPIKGTAGNTNPTPVSDGKSIYVVFGSGIVAAYDLEGRRQWIRWFDLPPAPEYGRAASPVLADGKLIVCLKHLQALNPANGEPLWSAPRVAEMYGTPAAAKIGQVTVLITPTGHVVRASDGAILASGLGVTTYNSPLVVGSSVYFIDTTASAIGLPQQAGDKVEVKKLWDQDLEGEYFASPIYEDGRIHVASNEGKYYVLDAATGKVLLEHGLDIPANTGRPGVPQAHIYPSLSLAGKAIYLGNDAGQMLVLAPGAEYKEVARNRLAEGSGGTPAFGPGRIYLRGGESLYCIGE